MSISVIIPTFNESNTIVETVTKVRNADTDSLKEIIIVDGGSTDETIQRAKKINVRLLHSPQKGRAAQMNYGAKQAHGDILYFLHADSHPPLGFDKAIGQAIEKGCEAGCFQLSFDDDHFALQFYAWFTRFDIDSFRFGDQSLFVKQAVFNQIQGFREDHMVMEDQEIIRRIKSSFSFTVLNSNVTTSARKYRRHGVIKLQLIFAFIFLLYYLGIAQQKLVKLYKKFLHSH